MIIIHISNQENVLLVTIILNNMENTEKKLLVITPGREITTDSEFYLLESETGEVLAIHLCSGFQWAKQDLVENRPERIEEFTKRFGEFEVKFLDETNITEEELLERNHIWYEANKDKQEFV